MTGLDYVELGYISGVFGVKGWVKVFSSTEPRENILSYSPWILVTGDSEREYEVVGGGARVKTVVASLEGVDTREEAQLLCGSSIRIRRKQLPTLPDDEYYWTDLIGLGVITVGGSRLGRVDSIIETGANDVLVVVGDEQRLIPFIRPQVVTEIDLLERKIFVDWDPDY